VGGGACHALASGAISAMVRRSTTLRLALPACRMSSSGAKP
jgi:hypothetical protein